MVKLAVPSSSRMPPVVLLRPLAFFEPESLNLQFEMRIFFTPLARMAKAAISVNAESSMTTSALPIRSSPLLW